MAATNYTPIQLYYSVTASAVPIAGNLLNGELAINIRDKKLYAKDNTGAVFLLASATSAAATVSSVNVSGGSTGLTTSGGPITTSGTITLAGTLAVTNGGTGAVDASGARTNLGLGTMATQNSNLVSITGGALSGVTISGATSTLSNIPNSALTNSSVTIGSTVLSLGGTLTSLAGVTISGATNTLSNIGNSSLTNSSMTFGSTSVALGATASSITGLTLVTPSMASIVNTGTLTLPTSTDTLVGRNTTDTLTNKTISGSNNTLSNIPNSALTNNSLTIGTTSIALGATSLTLGGLTSVTVTQDPVSALELTTKQYVDALAASGVHFHAPVRVESPTALTATYNNGASGVGATLTNAGTQVALVIDGVTLSVSDRVLIYTQVNQTQNGIYVVTNVGSGSTNWVLTRSSDANTFVINSANGLSEGSTVFVQQGATGSGETYTCNTTGVITFGTTNITFVQISSAQIYSAGTGLTLTGTTFSITPVGTAGTKGSASSVPVFVTNASGQVTSSTDTAIAISATQVTSGTLDSGRLAGNYSGITGVGTLASGVWNGTVIGSTYGGTGVNNGTSTITIGGAVTFTGAYTFGATLTNNTAVTFPTSGTLVNSAVTTLSSLVSIGTITSGTWNGTVIGSTYGGTGVNNGGNTITLGGNVSTAGAFTLSGAYPLTFTLTGSTAITLPTSGTLVSSTVTTLSNLASIGTITSGVWNGSLIGPTYGGTGVNNGSSTITLGGSLTVSGAYTLGITLSGNTSLTFPTTGALLTDSGTALLTNKALQPRVVVIADATSITMDADTTDMATQANTQAIGTLTVNAPTGTPLNGQKIILRLRSTNVQTFSWNAVFTGSVDIPLPTTSSGGALYDYVGFIYNTTATKWQMIAKNFGG